MATQAQLRERSASLFGDLLRAQTTRVPARRGARGVTAALPTTFSWFDPGEAVAAAAMSFRLSALAASRARRNDGLARALDHVEERMADSNPELVRQGFALFVTHNRDGRRLTKPRTVAAAPGLFQPVGRRRGRARAISIGGAAPGLDYWREDALANEHHQHWHEVYPYTGLPPRDFREWVTETQRADMVEILEALAPGQNWAGQIASATVAQLGGLFADVVQARGVRGLPAALYRKLFRLNDRQGELFFYMHQQMLARYDAELLSNDLGRVEPFGPAQWTQPIPEGHDPIGLNQFGRRDPNQQLAATDVTLLESLRGEVDTDLAAGALQGPTGPVAIDRTNIGEAVESTIGQLRELDPAAYAGLHNLGHGAIARLSTPPRPGVMTSTVTAIRDQVFWRWHKYIDEFDANWQDSQDPYDLSDAPTVVVRNGLTQGSSAPWASPDIILCHTTDLPANRDLGLLGASLFGGANWATDFTTRPAPADGTTIQTVDELTTTIASGQFGGRTIQYLTHEPFSYFLRLENIGSTASDVTVRIFLAPATHAHDRRAWIEMDKFLTTLPARTQHVLYRADTEASAVKRPVDTNPAQALAAAEDPNDLAYCDCGWPYTLLLPRGTPAGLRFRLAVICTDATIDQLLPQDQCGSMSYCGAVERYPDTRDMGYPFSRPFPGPTATAIRDAIMNTASWAARSLTIRHT